MPNTSAHAKNAQMSAGGGGKVSPDVADLKVSPPMWDVSATLARVAEATNVGSTGITEVISAPDIASAVKQTISHPVFLAVVVGATLLLLR